LSPNKPGARGQLKIAPGLSLPMFQSFLKMRKRSEKRNEESSGQLVTSPLGEGRGDQEEKKHAEMTKVPRSELLDVLHRRSRTIQKIKIR